MKTGPTDKKKRIRRGSRKPLDKDKRKRYTCIVCPACCELETDGVEVNGARCPKGDAFARQEMIMPLRVITTTIRCETSKGTRMVPVKTACPVPLSRIFEIMKQIKSLRLFRIPPVGTRMSTICGTDPLELVVTGELN